MTTATEQAALSFMVTGGNRIQLLPAYDFRAKDGRPKEAQRWKINSTIAAKIINQIDSQQDQALIDYDHQTLNTQKNAQPAPAAGWFKNLQWIEGVGLFAVGVHWTDKAKALIAALEYRYISPVFNYNKQTGEITGLLMASLVNYPAIDGMQDVVAAKAQVQFNPAYAVTEEEARIINMMGLDAGEYIATRNSS